MVVSVLLIAVAVACMVVMLAVAVVLVGGVVGVGSDYVGEVGSDYVC